jgi:hypothetical protein
MFVKAKIHFPPTNLHLIQVYLVTSKSRKELFLIGDKTTGSCKAKVKYGHTRQVVA